MELKATAYPKVNINLYVGKKRPDGYHPIASVFHIVRDKFYKDEITIRISDSEITSVNVEGLSNVADKINNTLYKAAMLYLQEANLVKIVEIKIKKNIPSLAGLGGGSSDAGAVLNALNDYYKILTDKEIFALAAEIGSDVPFFVCKSDAAVITGRGEFVKPIKARADLIFSLYPGTGEKKSTRFAYELLDKRDIIRRLPSSEYLEQKYYESVANWDFTNDFAALYQIIDGKHLTGSGTWSFSVKEVGYLN